MEAILNTIAQWGSAGAVLALAVYILWHEHKVNLEKGQKADEFIKEQLKTTTFRNNTSDSFDVIIDRLDKLEESVKGVTEKLDNHINKEENLDVEANRLEAIVSVAPAIHTLLHSYIDSCNADHVLFATLHNGNQTLCGVPYMKFDVIAEKFYPIRNPQDEEMARVYKNAELIVHDKLPAAVMQNPRVCFDIENDVNNHLEQLDSALYHRIIKRGIKHIAFEAIKDVHGRVDGFLCAYSFDDPLDMKVFAEAANTLNSIYKNTLINRI